MGKGITTKNGYVVAASEWLDGTGPQGVCGLVGRLGDEEAAFSRGYSLLFLDLDWATCSQVDLVLEEVAGKDWIKRSICGTMYETVGDHVGPIRQVVRAFIRRSR